MNGRAQLIALWTIAAIAGVILIAKGRGLPPTSGSFAAFSLAGSNGGIRVKVTGIKGKSGVYSLPEGAVVGSVINMTPQGVSGISFDCPYSAHILKDGQWVDFETIGTNQTKISLKMMSVEERMLLGIPLDPSDITEGDWERLPGIGPALARRIVLNRQSNGGFRSVRDLERVLGIGKATVDKVKRYF